MAELVKEIDNAKKYVDVAMYSLTYQPLAKALVGAHDRGVKVYVLMDRIQSQGTHSQYRYISDADIDVIPDRHAGIMHNKIAIIDGRILFVGSYNWTESAEQRNQENLLKFTDERDIIKVYQDRLNYLWVLNAPLMQRKLSLVRRLNMPTALELIQIATLIALIIYVIKTWHMASATKGMAEASRRSLEEMKESRDLLIRPYVTVHFDVTPLQGVFELVIENTGSGSAHDIKFKFDPALRTSRENLMDLEIFKNGISFLAPHQKIKLFFDVGFSYFRKSLPIRYEVEVTYKGGLEHTLRREIYTLDLLMYKDLRSLGRKGLHELVQVMEKVLKEIQKQQMKGD